MQELSPSGLGQFAPTANMLTGLGIDEFFQRTDANGAQSFVSDALGSTLALTNAAGSISTSYTYEPFGNVSISPSATNTNPYQFTGRENDGTGLDYYRARYYSAAFQRFVAQDPAEFTRGSLNLYAYAEGDPIDTRDPSGKGLSGVAPPTPIRSRQGPLGFDQCDRELGCDACAVLGCTAVGAAAGVNPLVDVGCAALVVPQCHRTFKCGGEGPRLPKFSTKFPPPPPPPPGEQPEPMPIE